MSNSPMVVFTKISPNKTVNRTSAIDRISPHCVVGQTSAESLGAWFAKESTRASSNYGIDKDGRIGMYVEEKDRSWCTSSRANDMRAVTIECASDTKHPYAMKEVVYEKLIELCVDICKRNGKTKLLWIADKDRALNYKQASDEMLITVHRWFANKSCPGDWLYERLGDLASKVTTKLNTKLVEDNDGDVQKVYRIQLGAHYDEASVNAELAKVKAAGFSDAHIVESTIKLDGIEPPKVEEPWVPAVGDIVMFNGKTHYPSANSTNGIKCSTGKAKITNIYQPDKSKHPYHLVMMGSKGPYGWVDKDSFTKI